MTETYKDDEPDVEMPDEDELPCNNCGRRVNMYEEPIYPMPWPDTERVYYLCEECVNAIKMV